LNLKKAKLENRLEARLKHYTNYHYWLLMKLDTFQFMQKMPN